MGELARILVEKVATGVRYFVAGYLIGYAATRLVGWLFHLGH